MFTWTGAWGQTTRGVVYRVPGPLRDEGGWACRQLGPQLFHPHLPPQPRTRFHALRKASLRLPPCTPGPRAFFTSTPGTHSRVRGRATSGRQVGWGRAAAGGQVEGVEVELRGLQAGGGPWVHSCIAAGGGPEGPSQAHSGDGERGGQGWVGPSAGRLQDGWGPKEGVSPAARAALGASASLFLGINIYRFICRLPYTLGCLPPGKNRAGFPTPARPPRPHQGRGQRGPGEARSVLQRLLEETWCHGAWRLARRLGETCE